MSGLYTNFVTQYGLGNIDLVDDTIKLSLLSDSYVFDSSDVYLSELSSDLVGTSIEIGGTKSVSSDDIFDTSEDELKFVGVPSGSTTNAILMYKDTGVPTTSELIAILSDDFKGITKTTNGSDIWLIKNTGGFFQVTPEDVYAGRIASFANLRVSYPRNYYEFRS